MKKKDKMTMVKQRYYLIPSLDINDKRTMGSNCIRRTRDLIQKKVAVSHAAFPLLKCPCKKF